MTTQGSKEHTPVTDAYPTRLVLRSIEEALHPKGMSTHDGIVKLAGDHVLAILARSRALEADRDHLAALNKELVEALETLKDVAAICLRTAPDNDGSRMLHDHIKVARAALAKAK